MWGQDVLADMDFSGLRIIPTRVGTSSCSFISLHISWDHPHACGDKVSPEKMRQIACESSPRVWGQGSAYRLYNSRSGIIPTRVGTSIFGKKTLSDDRDHPHACGDKSYPFCVALGIIGSSPRVWGQDWVKAIMDGDSRIIPTRVGTSAQSQRRKAYN